VKKIAAALAVLTGSGLLWAGCSQNAPPIVVRSLERSGRAAFLCINDPRSPNPGQQLDACFTPGDLPGQFNYIVPHVIALVTQTARGEVAVVDVTADTVVDIDRSVPGYNFLPVGASPTDIVSTPAGNASFVGIGDPTRPAIFAIPSSSLPLWEDTSQPQPPPKTIASWPACALPPGGVPTEMVLVPDTTASSSDPGRRRAHCDGSPGQDAARGTDLSSETEMFGRLKLVVTLPELGEIDVIDAQDLLSRRPGEFEPCTVERRVFLTVDSNLPPATPKSDAGAGDVGVSDAADPADGMSSPDGAGGGPAIDAGPDGATCSGRVTPSAPPSLKPHPFAMALSDDGRLFVSDDSASVIHVVDMQDPCTAEEKAPLLPFSVVDPTRSVVSGAIAVSPLTSKRERFVYAADIKNNGSIMVFDVSANSTERAPLVRQDRRYNPFEPPDRIALPAPVESMTFAIHEVPLAPPDPTTGVIPRGMVCDPNNENDPNRPPEDFVQAGAGPRRLRGIFGFAALTNGDLTVIDLDDFDANCRRPRYSGDDALGCRDQSVPITGLPAASQEASCNIIEPHRVRSANYFTNVEAAGRHAPAMLTFPLLYDKDGTALSNDPSRPETARLPRLLGPALVREQHDDASWPILATVLSSVVSPGAGLFSNLDEAQANWVTFDLQAPRAHVAQIWNVTYEGVLPWFVARRGRLQCAGKPNDRECEQGDDASHFDFYDSSVGFCDGGAQGEDLAPAGDILEIIDDMPDPADPYWTTTTDVCSRAECEEVFGTLEAPRVIENGEPVGRDIAIEKSYQGKLSLKKTNTSKRVGDKGETKLIPITCCFPYPVAYTIRAGHQWIVTGQSSGFAHRLIPDPTQADPISQACIVSCDENLQLRNGRLVGRAADDPEGVPTYDDATPEGVKGKNAAGIFYNAQMRFVLWDREGATCTQPPCAGRVRDRFFSFQEVGGFTPMRFGLSSSAVMPQSIRYVRGLQMLAIPDSVTQGLMLFDLNRLVTVTALY